MGSKALETSTKLALLFLLLNLSVWFSDSARTCGFRRRVHIQMVHGIEHMIAPNTKLLVHCLSKHSDVGIQNLSLGDDYKWSFCPDTFGRTKYWCYLEWTDVTLLKVASTFDIYKDHSKTVGCKTDCFWAATEEGIYRDGIKVYGWFRGNATELSV